MTFSDLNKSQVDGLTHQRLIEKARLCVMTHVYKRHCERSAAIHAFFLL
jgi:hypothetical protein